jgi:hypothetical protein
MIAYEWASWNSSSSRVSESTLTNLSFPLDGSPGVECKSFEGGMPFIRSSLFEVTADELGASWGGGAIGSDGDC